MQSMHPVWQFCNASRFGSRLWPIPAASHYMLQNHNNLSRLTSSPSSNALLYNNHFYTRPINAPDSLAYHQLHLKMDDMHLSTDTIGREKQGLLSSTKRTRSLPNMVRKLHRADDQSALSLDSSGIDDGSSSQSDSKEDRLPRMAYRSQQSNIRKECLLQMENHLQYLRSWKEVQKLHLSAEVQEFSLMSYNVLAQKLLEANHYLYRHCDPEILEWEYRKKKLFKEMINSKADILCLQEVQEDHYKDDFQPYFEQKGFHSLYKKRTGGKNDGCAIFYKTEAFELVEWVAVEYQKPGVYLLDRDNIGIVALFRPAKQRDTSNRICVATTHLLFNPRRGDIKLAQLQVLLAEIDNMAFKRTSSSGQPRYHPVILCGDMNSEPYCQIYNFVCMGMLHYLGLHIAKISGQRDGMFCKNKRALSAELLPPWLGITNQCQYIHRAAAHRHISQYEVDKADQARPASRERIEESNAQNCKYAVDENALHGSVTEWPPCFPRHAYSPEELQSLFSTGCMLHRLNLMSVYKHELERAPGMREITTQHSKASCTVDYIFYSVSRKESHLQQNLEIKHQHVKENNLKLLGYCELLSEVEVRQFGGLPNAVSASDHLPLVAKFALKL